MSDQTARVQGVDVDADERVVADDDGRVAHRSELPADLVKGLARTLNKELGAEPPALLRRLQGVGSDLGRLAFERGGARRLRSSRDLLAPHSLQEAFEDHHQSVAAGIDNPGFTEDRQL